MGKPWWTDQLQTLWDDVRKCEHKYLNFTGCRRGRQNVRGIYVTARNRFDKTLRQSERRYRAAKRDELFCKLKQTILRRFGMKLKT